MNEVEVYGSQLPDQTDGIDPFDPVGVLKMERIPPAKYSPAPYTWTSNDLINAMKEWVGENITLKQALQRYKIPRMVFYGVSKRYPEVKALFEYARGAQASILSGETREMYQNIPPEAYEVGKDGNKRLSQSWVTWTRDKAHNNHRLSAVYESGTHLQKQIVETTNRSVSIQLKGEMPKRVVDKAAALDDLLH